MAIDIGRREFISALGGAAATWPLAARAQQQAKLARVGIIDDAPIWNHFRQGLHDLGYVEAQTIAFEYRTAEGEPERLAAVATELARVPVDVLAAYGTAPAKHCDPAPTPAVAAPLGTQSAMLALPGRSRQA
jgi:putative ABC transport system substrate-binding protein